MAISPLILAGLFAASFIFGIFMGVLNDLHRIMRVFLGVRYSKKRFEKLYDMKIKIINRSIGNIVSGRLKNTFVGIILFFQDIILFIVAAFGVVILNFYFNKGEFRIFTVAALLAGFVLYYFTVGKIVMLVSEAIAIFLKAGFLILIYIISRPFVFFHGRIVAIYRKLYKYFSVIIEKKQNIRYNKKERRKILSASEKGFINFES